LTLGSFKPSLVGWIHYDPKWHSSGWKDWGSN
jgi:hypothetical protein